jgi:hypothetical protein
VAYEAAPRKNPFLLSFFLSFFFGSTGVCTQGLTLVRQALYHLNHSIIPERTFSMTLSKQLLCTHLIFPLLKTVG